MILVEPINVSVDERSGLHLGGQPRFPTSGFIYALGAGSREAFKVGDFVVFDEHGVEHDSQLQDTFILQLQDEAGTHFVRCDTDIEPVIHEYVQRYHDKGEVRWVTVKDLDREDEEVKFLSSEVVDYGIGTYTQSGYSLSYRHHTELHPLDTKLDHPTLMLVPEREILFYIERDDLRENTGGMAVHRIRNEQD